MVDLLSFTGSEDGEHPSGEVLMMYVDGELPSQGVPQVQSHLEACWHCRVRTEKIEAAIADIVEFDLEVLKPAINPPNGWNGFKITLDQAVREGRQGSSVPTVARFARAVRLALARFARIARAEKSAPLTRRPGAARPSTPGRNGLWLRLGTFSRSEASLWLRGAAIAVWVAICVAVLFWLHASNQPVVIAREVAVRSEQQQRAWLNQPGKVLHWVVEVDISNSAKLPDGHYRSLYWRDNRSDNTGYIIRTYDAAGKLVYGNWRDPEGSEVRLNRINGEHISVFPTTAELRKSLSQLNPESAEVLKSFLKNRESQSSLKLLSTSDDHWFSEALNRGQVVEFSSPEHGPSYRVTTEESGRETGVIRVVKEQDFEKESFRRYRLKSIRYMADSSTAVETSNWTYFAEVPATDFDLHDLQEELAGTSSVEYLSAEDIVRDWARRQQRPGVK